MKTNLTDGQTIAALLIASAILISIIVFWPLAVIWSLNTLFPLLAIPYSFYNWIAVVFLTAVVFGNSAVKLIFSK